MFRKSSEILQTEAVGLVFPNPLGVPYSLKKKRCKWLCAAPKAGFFVLTAPSRNVLPWIKELQTALPDTAVLAVEVKTDILRTFSLVYDFAGFIIVDPDTDNGIDAADLGDTIGLLDEMVSLRLCYEHYTPVFLRLRHGITPEELHTLLDTCRLSGLDGVAVTSLSMVSTVRDLTQGRVPILCSIQTPEEGVQALQEGAVLLEAKTGFKGSNKLMKLLEKQ